MKVASDYLQLSAETNNRIRCTHGHLNNGYQLTGECKSELQSVNWFLVGRGVYRGPDSVCEGLCGGVQSKGVATDLEYFDVENITFIAANCKVY